MGHRSHLNGVHETHYIVRYTKRRYRNGRQDDASLATTFIKIFRGKNELLCDKIKVI